MLKKSLVLSILCFLFLPVFSLADYTHLKENELVFSSGGGFVATPTKVRLVNDKGLDVDVGEFYSLNFKEVSRDSAKGTYEINDLIQLPKLNIAVPVTGSTHVDIWSNGFKDITSHKWRLVVGDFLKQYIRMSENTIMGVDSKTQEFTSGGIRQTKHIPSMIFLQKNKGPVWIGKDTSNPPKPGIYVASDSLGNARVGIGTTITSGALYINGDLELTNQGTLNGAYLVTNKTDIKKLETETTAGVVISSQTISIVNANHNMFIYGVANIKRNGDSNVVKMKIRITAPGFTTVTSEIVTHHFNGNLQDRVTLPIVFAPPAALAVNIYTVDLIMFDHGSTKVDGQGRGSLAVYTYPVGVLTPSQLLLATTTGLPTLTPPNPFGEGTYLGRNILKFKAGAARFHNFDDGLYLLNSAGNYVDFDNGEGKIKASAVYLRDALTLKQSAPFTAGAEIMTLKDGANLLTFDINYTTPANLPTHNIQAEVNKDLYFGSQFNMGAGALIMTNDGIGIGTEPSPDPGTLVNINGDIVINGTAPGLTGTTIITSNSLGISTNRVEFFINSNTYATLLSHSIKLPTGNWNLMVYGKVAARAGVGPGTSGDQVGYIRLKIGSTESKESSYRFNIGGIPQVGPAGHMGTAEPLVYEGNHSVSTLLNSLNTELSQGVYNIELQWRTSSATAWMVAGQTDSNSDTHFVRSTGADIHVIAVRKVL